MLFTNLDRGEILGLFIYAAVITAVVVRYLTIKSMREEDRMGHLEESLLDEASNNHSFAPVDDRGSGSSSGSAGDDRESTVHFDVNPLYDNKSDPSSAIPGHADGDDKPHLLREDSQSQYQTYTAKRGELILSSARLVVGWSWAEFVAACFAATLPSHNSFDEVLWLGVFVKFVVAAIAVGVGSMIELWRINAAEKKAHSRISSVDSNFSVGSDFDNDNNNSNDALRRSYSIDKTERML